VSIVPSEEMDPDIAAAIAQISQGPNGEVRVRLHDKHAALVSIGRPVVALTGGSTMSTPTSARGGKAEMLRTTPIRRS
jgi:hypothetical protein